MKQTPKIRFALLVAPLAVWIAAAPLARADDSTKDFPAPTEGAENDTPPPAKEQPKADDVPAAAKPKTMTPSGDSPSGDPTSGTTPAGQMPAGTTPAAPAAKDAWSAPAMSAPKSTGALPPPKIIRRRGGMPARTASQPPPPPAPSPAATSPAAPGGTSGMAPPPPGAPGRVVHDVASTRPAMPPPPARAPAVRSTSDTRSSPQPAAPPLVAMGTPGCRIYSIAKTHNVELAAAAPASGSDAAAHELAMRLDVDYELRGQAGHDVYVAIWFARADTGTLVSSGLAGYADAAGHVTLQTRAARVQQDATRYVASLQIPYRAFPVASGQDAYDVEARVQVLRDEGGGRVSVLCKGSTTFRVYGYSDDTGSGSR